MDRLTAAPGASCLFSAYCIPAAIVLTDTALHTLYCIRLALRPPGVESKLLRINRFIATPPAHTILSSSHARPRCLSPRALLVFTTTAATQGAAARCATTRLASSTHNASRSAGMELRFRYGAQSPRFRLERPHSCETILEGRSHHLVPGHAPMRDRHRRHRREPHTLPSHIAETLQGDLFHRAAEIKNSNHLQGCNERESGFLPIVFNVPPPKKCSLTTLGQSRMASSPR